MFVKPPILPQVLSEVLEDLRPLGLHALLHTGSQAVNLGNSLSDIDLIGIVDGDDQDGARLPDRDYVSGTLTVDVQLLRLGQISRAAAVVHGPLPVVDAYGAGFRVRPWLRDVCRLEMARPVVGRAAWKELRTQFDWDQFRRWTLYSYAVDGTTLTRDAAGALQGGDMFTAAECCLRVIRVVGEMVLAATGDYYYSSKWLGRRLTRQRGLSALGSQLARDSFDGLKLLDGGPLGSEVADQIARVAGVAAAVLLRGWGSAWIHREGASAYYRYEARSLRRAPFWFPIRCADSAVLMGKGSRVVTIPGLVVWSLADGTRSAAEVVADFAGVTGVSMRAGRRFAYGCLEELCDVGLVMR